MFVFVSILTGLPDILLFFIHRIIHKDVNTEHKWEETPSSGMDILRKDPTGNNTNNTIRKWCGRKLHREIYEATEHLISG